MTIRSLLDSPPRPRATPLALAISLLLAIAALGAVACSRSETTNFSVLHVFYTADAIGYIEPCG